MQLFLFQGKSVKSHWFQRYTYSCIETGFSYEFLFWADPVPIHQHYYTFKTWLSFLSWSGQPVSGQPIRCKAQWAQTHTLGLSPALSIEEIHWVQLLSADQTLSVQNQFCTAVIWSFPTYGVCSCRADVSGLCSCCLCVTDAHTHTRTHTHTHPTYTGTCVHVYIQVSYQWGLFSCAVW